MTVLARIPKQSLADAVFEQLGERIVAGAFPAGEPLPPERLLCEELGVSRTAVREAVARLEQIRLLAVRHGGETLVQDWRTSGGLDLLPLLMRRAGGAAHGELLQAGMEMRAVLAPDIARLAALRAGAQVNEELETVLEEMSDDAPDLLALQALSLRFWAALTQGSGNPAYQLAFNSLRDAILSLREPVAAAMAAQLRDLAGFRAIAHAVRKRDAKAAAAATRAHINVKPRGRKK